MNPKHLQCLSDEREHKLALKWIHVNHLMKIKLNIREFWVCTHHIWAQNQTPIRQSSLRDEVGGIMLWKLRRGIFVLLSYVMLDTPICKRAIRALRAGAVCVCWSDHAHTWSRICTHWSVSRQTLSDRWTWPSRQLSMKHRWPRRHAALDNSWPGNDVAVSGQISVTCTFVSTEKWF